VRRFRGALQTTKFDFSGAEFLTASTLGADMTTSPSAQNTSSPSSSDSPESHTNTTDQREALERSEKKAAETQPGSYKEKETEEKRVEIGPDLTDNPIKGIDPADEVKR